MSATELTPKQRRAVAALVEHGEILAAADAADVSRSTLYQWLKTPAFMAALRDAEADALRSLTRSLVSLGKRATGVIAETMDDPKANASTRLRAADVVLTRLLQLRELVDLEERVAALEASVAAQGANTHGTH